MLPVWIYAEDAAATRTEAAVSVLAALVAATVTATLVVLLWVAAGGPARPEARLPRAIREFGTAGATLVAALAIAAGAAWWCRAAFGPQIGHVGRLLVPAGMLAALVALVRHRGRAGSLDTISANLGAISRRSVLIVAPAAAAVAWLGGVRWRPTTRAAMPAGPLASARPPNILLVTFDALSAADTSLHGYRLPTTPNLDRLARQAIVFERYHAASNFTTAAVATMLTGTGVPTHGIRTIRSKLPSGWPLPTLPEMLRLGGYATGAVVCNPAAHPLHLGLDAAFDDLPPPALREGGLLSGLAYHFTHTDLGDEVQQAIGDRITEIESRIAPTRDLRFPYPIEPALDRAREFIRDRPRPWFLWLHVMPPHYPYAPQGAFAGRFLGGDDYTGLPGSDSGLRGVQYGTAYPDELQPEIDKLRLRYNEFTAYADERLGGFLDALAADGTLADTALAISADHGESFGHGVWGHEGLFMWQSVIHVPLIVRLPDGTGAGSRVAALCGGVDLMPTVLDIAGIAAPAGLEGASLKPLWQGEAEPPRRRSSVVITSPHGAPIGRGVVAVMEGHEKYILDIARGAGRLYDLARDPGETEDLAAARPDRAAALKESALAVLGA
jgi:arylsulfatase A-like enzyme